MSWLAVFVSHNFPHYLQNAVRSCRLLYPEAMVLVVDNASSRPDMIALLNRLESEQSVEVIRRNSNETERKAGSLHAGYNVAIDYALERDFEFVHFANDDVQFVYRNEDLLPTLRAVYEIAPRTAGIHSTLAKQLTPLNDRLIPLTGVPASKDLSYGISDNGFAAVKFLKDTGFKFLGSEGESSARAKQMGYHACQLHRPVLAFVPWTASRVGGAVVGREFPPPQELYLKPIVGSLARDMEQTPPGAIPTFDDWCRPWGWSALVPFWATAPSVEYLKLYVKRYSGNRPLQLPYFVSDAGRVRLSKALSKTHSPSLRFLLFAMTVSLARKFFSLRATLK